MATSLFEKRPMMSKAIACPECSDTGLVPINAECANGRCDHGSNVELCYVGCVFCPMGTEKQRDLMVLLKPQTPDRQRRAS